MTTTTTKTRPVWGCPAATLTLPVDAPQEAWHAQRLTGVGGSEIGVIAGLTTYPGTNRYTLWQEKTGEATEPVYDQATLDQFRFGRAMEDTLAAWWSEDTGLTTRRVGSYRSKTVEYALANPDRASPAMVACWRSKPPAATPTPARPISRVRCRHSITRRRTGTPAYSAAQGHYISSR